MSSNLQDARSGNFTLTFPALTGISGAATTYTTTNAFSFSVKGDIFSKAAVAGGTTPTTNLKPDGTSGVFTAITAGKSCMFLWSVNAAGTVAVSQGPVVNTDDISAKARGYDWPQLPDTNTAFAYVLIAGASTVVGNWTFGASNWNATGITATVRNCMVPQSRPLTA
jgi:hypothetical protein